jgi:hypothetical protein
MFPILNSQKQGDALSLLLFNLAINKAKENQDATEREKKYQLLVLIHRAIICYAGKHTSFV